MRTASRLILSAALATTTLTAMASDLAPGSKAPALSVKKWYKGAPVTSFKAKGLYVVEFWATWCGPCRDSIPHLTEMAKKNKDVTFIGVSIWEDDKGDTIPKFVKEMGAKMDYHVGYSGNKTGMSKTWMEASGQNGIPTAFVVKDRKVLWIGHPMDMEKPLAEIKSGKFNLAKHKAEVAKEAEANRVAVAGRKELEGVHKLIKEKKYEQASTKLDEIVRRSPGMEAPVENIRFLLLAKMDPEKWDAKAREMAAGHKGEDMEMLCMFALEQASNPDSAELTKRAIEYAVGAATDADTMTFYYAASFFDQTKDAKKALLYINKAVESLPKGTLKDSKQAKEALKQIQAEYAKKAKG